MDRTNETLTLVKNTLLTVLVLYFIIAFINLEFNFFKWTYFQRMTLVLLTIWVNYLKKIL